MKLERSVKLLLRFKGDCLSTNIVCALNTCILYRDCSNPNSIKYSFKEDPEKVVDWKYVEVLKFLKQRKLKLLKE
jgi:hypothetical protein